MSGVHSPSAHTQPGSSKSSSPAHTPGPWHLQSRFRSIYAMTGGTSGLTIFVAKTEGHQCGEGQAGANARLIAAAPDLLEALRRTTELLASANRSTDRPSEYVSRAVREARAVVERATTANSVGTSASECAQ